MSERIREVPSPRRTTTTYVADRATIRVAVPQGWARGVLAGVEAAFAGWGLITVFTMIAYLTLRSNSWMNDTTPRDALGLGGDLWAAVIGGTSVVGDVHYRAIPTLMGALLIVLVRILLRTTAGYPRSAALFARAWLPADLVAPGGGVGYSFALVDGHDRRRADSVDWLGVVCCVGVCARS